MFANYDWIQWYTFVGFSLSGLMLILDTSEYVRTYEHRVVGMIGCLPYVGRVLGWW